MADRLLALVPHEQTHAPRSISEQARKLGPDATGMRAIKHTMPARCLIMHYGLTCCLTLCWHHIQAKIGRSATCGTSREPPVCCATTSYLAPSCFGLLLPTFPADIWHCLSGPQFFKPAMSRVQAVIKMLSTQIAAGLSPRICSRGGGEGGATISHLQSSIILERSMMHQPAIMCHPAEITSTRHACHFQCLYSHPLPRSLQLLQLSAETRVAVQAWR